MHFSSKNILSAIGIFLLITSLSHAQNVGINATGAAPDASAMLDVDMTGKGLLIPRMTTAQRPASPVTSLIIYNTTLAWFEYWDGTAWIPLLSSSSGWSLSGNSISGSEWIGTISNSDWVIKTNNTERMRVQANGTLKITGANTSPGIWMNGTISAIAATAYGILSRGTLTAVANSDAFLPISTCIGTVNTGTFTGLNFYGGHFDAASWTKTGTGTIDKGYGLYVTAPSIATSNYAASFTGGNVGIETIAPQATLHVANQATGRQLIVGSWAWADISSNTAGRGLFGGNMYTDHNPQAFKYSETHASIGAMGFAVNYPVWNKASVITSATTSSTAGTAFTPSVIVTFDYTGRVGIGNTNPAAALHVEGNSGTTLKIVDGNQASRKVLTSDAAGMASWAYPLGYSLQANSGATGTTPLDASTYYFGSIPDVLGITADISRVYIPRAGVIKACYVFFNNAGVLATGETGSVYIRINNTTDVLVSSAVTNDAVGTSFSSSSLSQAVNAGDYFEIKWTTPNWVTNPTSVKASAVVYIE